MYRRRRFRRRGPMRRVPFRGRGFLRTGGVWGRFRGNGRELKFIDKTIASSTVLASGTQITATGEDTLLDISQGTGESQRIGRKITVKKLMIRGNIDLIATSDSSDTHDIVRILGFIDTQTNGVEITLGSLLASTNHNAFRNMNVPTRFKMLFDFQINISSMAGAGNGTTNTFSRNIKAFQKYVNLNLPVVYNGTTGAVAEIQQNNIGMIAVSKHALATIIARVRIRYTG